MPTPNGVDKGIVNGGFVPDHDAKKPGSTAKRHNSYGTAVSDGVTATAIAQDDQLGKGVQGPDWDVFTTSDPDVYNALDGSIWMKLRRIFKVVTIALCFIVAVAAGVMGKLTFALIATNIKLENQISNCTKSNQTTMQVRNPDNKHVLMSWTWSLILALCFPYVITFLKNLWKVISFSKPHWDGFPILLMTLFFESIHSACVVIFTTVLLPDLDILHSIAVTAGLGIIPGLLQSLQWDKKDNVKRNILHRVLSVTSTLAQLSALFVFPTILSLTEKTVSPSDYAKYLCLVGISSRWWLNYITKSSLATKPLLKSLIDLKYALRQSNSLLHCIVAFWKITTIFLGILASVSIRNNIDFTDFFNFSNFSKCNIPNSDNYCTAPIIVSVLNIAVSFIFYYVALHAYKSKIALGGFALPAHLITPLAMGAVGIAAFYEIQCSLIGRMPAALVFLIDTSKFGESPSLNTNYIIALAICTLIWLIAQGVLVRHVWTSPNQNIPPAQALFFLPMYDAECLEQSLLYNKRSHSKKSQRRQNRETRERADSDDQLFDDLPEGQKDPRISQIYFCATMWHESDHEMLLMMKSILRMDEDHFCRTNSQKLSGKRDPDFYNFETHIFFDDAFQPHRNDGGEYKVNDFVKCLLTTVPKAASLYYSNKLSIDPPLRIPTPYGGRLEWTLPGNNKLIAHLKDKMKIRVKKRWSQIMYMYYFLGYQIMANTNTDDDHKKLAAKNTYLLALDGDVDFKPEAVLLLVDMMKKNDDVGAACGRIHPIGTGPIVWYQKFEYAISHWLQKSTEHILGCVLCSPGCFSLFRGEALMHENVMNKYSTKSTQAQHYLQYDQGEDRWLCTLLLQAGFKVEYNAAADALTEAPTGFNEFYNQRRRWGPSTMANIFDLLMDLKNVIKVNSYMSLLYIMYQGSQFFASIVGPGTIFLMLIGAVSLVFKKGTGANLAIEYSTLINAVPVLGYVIVSFFVKEKTQLKMAKILSCLYALIMCLVLVTVLLEIVENYCSPSAVFFYAVAGTFLLAAILHPQEFSCIGHGLVYFVLIPCMYMLLIIYSFVNINNVSWGTREVKVANPDQAPQPAVVQKAPEKGFRLMETLSSFLKGGNSSGADNDDRSVACGTCCTMICCPTRKRDTVIDSLLPLNQKMDDLQRMVRDHLLKANHRDDDSSVSSSDDEPGPPENLSKGKAVNRAPSMRKISDTKKSISVKVPRDDMINPHWLDDPDTKNGQIVYLSEEEKDFWLQFIEKYLKPLDNNKDEQDKIKGQLMELRTNVNFGFLLINAMFVVIVFTLQFEKSLSIDWPCKGGNVKQNEKIGIEPIGLVFLFFFLLIMGLQFFGMIFHRLGTFWHIIATTRLFGNKTDRLMASLDDNKASYELFKAIVHEESDDDADDTISIADSESGGSPKLQRRGSRRQTTKKLLQRKISMAPTAVTRLEDIVQPGLESLQQDIQKDRLDEKDKRLRNMSQLQRKKTVHFFQKPNSQENLKRRLTQMKSSEPRQSRPRFLSEDHATTVSETTRGSLRDAPKKELAKRPISSLKPTEEEHSDDASEDYETVTSTGL